ncbi:hypothetical protein [Gryllotalpicola koreensis]|uniref:AAA family ATPase n=1 Tax=Gryllotalpicola koreensis TaxID=993086 RepID=A0ABP8A6D1_9MICO
MDLEDLGERICILGPSNSGKSTLAVAIGVRRELPVVHLDQYRHQPGTQWLQRPDVEFEALHDAAIAGERWVMEGNYSRWLPERLKRATGLVVLDASTAASILRYIRRTWGRADRAGALQGTRDRIRMDMIGFILGPTRQNRHRYRAVFEGFAGPKTFLPNRRRLRDFYRDNALTTAAR